MESKPFYGRILISIQSLRIYDNTVLLSKIEFFYFFKNIIGLYEFRCDFKKALYPIVVKVKTL